MLTNVKQKIHSLIVLGLTLICKFFMSDYKVIETETKGEVHIKINSQYNNIRADKVIVAENIKVRLFGTINELLHIKKDAEVYVHGTIKGKIVNDGKLHIY